MPRRKIPTAHARTAAEHPDERARLGLNAPALAGEAGESRRLALEAADDLRRLRYERYLADLGADKDDGTLESLAAGGAPRILAEGDSWFDFPFGGDPFERGDVVARLTKLINIKILNFATRGDEARQILGVTQRQRLKKALADPKTNFNVLLFSGGGNDIVGDPMALWIRPREPGMSTRDAIDLPVFEHALGVVRAAYQHLIAIRDRAERDTPGRQIHLVFHQYDFAIPNGKGVCGYGPWLRPALEYHGWHTHPDAHSIVRDLLRRFAGMLDGVAAGAPRVHIVRTQGTLDATDWNDELHPNRSGFGKIAAIFHAELRRLFPDSVKAP
ncbi:MAG: hypothetical protein HRU70_10045 [Phycisphaeraceae bacterium]|nr:MAG: hypothetical protein HRU70_10045 [Phycisphaeraceae bacterium]